MSQINNNSTVNMNQQIRDFTPVGRPSLTLSPALRPQVNAAREAFHERMGDLKGQLKNEQDPQRKLMLQNEIASLQKTFDKFQSAVGAAPASTLMHGGDLKTTVEGLVQEFRGELIESYDRIGFADTTLSQVFACGIEANVPVGGPVRLSDTPNVHIERAAAKDDANKTDGAASEAAEGTHRFNDMTPDELVTLMETDQKAFYSELKEMPIAERQLIMQQVQNQLQQINQMFSMLSQMSQAMHDTAKAVISNLRV